MSFDAKCYAEITNISMFFKPVATNTQKFLPTKEQTNKFDNELFWSKLCIKILVYKFSTIMFLENAKFYVNICCDIATTINDVGPYN